MANTKLPSRLLDTSAIPALNVTGDLTVDTTTLKVDSTNNRVGIGTAAANRLLEIAGNNNGGAKANYIRITDTDTSATLDNQQGGIEFYTNDNTPGIAASIEVVYAGSGGGGEITFNTAAHSSAGVLEAMRIDASGNVGIGTDNPGARLELDNPSSFTNMIEYGNVTWNQNSGHGLVAVNRGSDGYVQLQLTSGVDNADVFTIRNSGTGANVQHNLLSNGNVYHAGNVGIGDTAPGAKLSVGAGNASTFVHINNAASGDVSSGLNIMSGSTTTTSLYGNADEGWTTLMSGGSIGFRVNQAVSGFNPMNIDTSGRVTMPYQPAWGARSLSNANSSGGTTTAGEVLVFPSILYNVGNHYSNSTGLFTVPVAGRYFVTFSGLYNYADNTTGPAYIRVNTAEKYRGYHQGSGSNYLQVSMSGVVDVSVGDTINIYAVNDGWHIGGETSFSGFLIG